MIPIFKVTVIFLYNSNINLQKELKELEEYFENTILIPSVKNIKNYHPPKSSKPYDVTNKNYINNLIFYYEKNNIILLLL
jgi:hypothetical protein